MRARSSVRVRLTFATEKESDKYNVGMGISVQNPSGSEVHITNISFLYPYLRPTLKSRLKHIVQFRRIPQNMGWCHSALSNYGIDDKCPASIEPGKAHYIFVPSEVLDKIERESRDSRIKIIVQDALWRNKRSKVFDYMLPARRKKG